MKYSPITGPIQTLESDCLILAIFKDGLLSPSARIIDQASNGAIQRLVELGDAPDQVGSCRLLHQLPGVTARRLLLVGGGKLEELNPRQYAKALAAASKALQDTGAEQAISCLGELEIPGRDSYWKPRLAIAALEDQRYDFQDTKSKKKPARGPSHIALHVSAGTDEAATQRAIRDGSAIAAGSKLSRDLSNLPGNLCTPSYLAEQARKLAEGYDSLSLQVLEEAEMEELGMGALLSVSRGSRQPAKLIVLEYRGDGQQGDPVALVGKGLTFDAGGISIKPAANMDEMKYDMCGGASVLGALRACAELQLPLNVVGIVPSSENLPDGDANKPGDIVTTMSGQTVEVLNTDAEGRLILCDALTYSRRFKPAVAVDIATLTGACVVALGHHASGLLGNDQPLVDELLRAGQDSTDRAWQMPLWEEYQGQLDSNFADMANIGGRDGGTITAACFLSRYTKDLRWAHLDIAGTAWNSGKQKGATGRPVALLTQFLLNRCDSGDAE